MQRQLASLALDPQVSVDLLSLVEFDSSLDEDLLLQRLTLFADNIIVLAWQNAFTVHAGFFDNCEPSESRGSSNLWLIDSSSMFSGKECKLGLFAVIEDGLEYSYQGLLYLVFDVVDEINGDVVLKGVDWVL
jgi:hypothetical protein